MRLILASNNKNKYREISEILKDTDVEVVPQYLAGCDFEAEENGETFEENARIKALAAMRATGAAAVADDSGLMIDALGGAPGVYSARYGGENTGYDKKCAMLIKELEDKEQRTAKFVSSIVCVFPNGDEITAYGDVCGTIDTRMTGENGFGYDPIFIPDGYECSMACLTDDEKNAISHRGRAIRAFAEKLKNYLNDGGTDDDR